MFCPQCRAEYRAGFSRCSDCDVALVDSLVDENAMSPITKTSVREERLFQYPLEWVKTRRFKEEYELHSGDNVVATLKCGGSEDDATGQSVEGCWTFNQGLSKTTIRVCDSDTDLALFQWARPFRRQGNSNWLSELGPWLKPGPMTGTLMFSGGGKFRLTTKSFFGRNWEFQTETGTPLVRFTAGARFFPRFSTEVEILPTAGELSSLWVLVFLAGYFGIATFRASS